MSEHPKLEPEIKKLIEQVQVSMRACPGHEDDPPARVWAGLLAIMTRLEAHQAALEARPAGDVVQVVRQEVIRFLRPLAPVLTRGWRWQTVACLVAALAVWGAAVGLIVGRVEHDLGAAESQRWSAWCAVPAHISNIDGKSVCQVPMQ